METLGRRPFRKGMSPGAGQHLSSLDKQRPGKATFRGRVLSLAFAGQATIGQAIPDKIRFGEANPWSTFPARHARSFDSSIRPSWSGGQPVLHHDFNSGHPFAKRAKFGPDLVKFGPDLFKFSLDKSEIFAHVAAEVTDLGANA